VKLPRGRGARSLLLGLLAGGLYGLVLRILGNNESDPMVVMSLSFIAGVPIVMGIISVWRVEPLSMRARIFLPWGSVFIAILASAVFAIEGAICLVMGLPIMLLGATLGGFLELLPRKWFARRLASNLALVVILVLPVVSETVERGRPVPIEIHGVDSRITIDAGAATVWNQIVSVPAIRPAERHGSPIYWIGFPHPIAAALSRPGLGGVRRATFERGVTFIETITEWSPEHALGFTFHANTGEIPNTTLDAHVRVGGEFFDVLEGRYEIVPVDGHRCELRLSSQHRLSTRFNPYSALWSDFVMGEIQRTILGVIRDRCEAERMRSASS